MQLFLPFLKLTKSNVTWQEKRVCCELRLSPAIYLQMQQDLCIQILSGNISSKSDAHRLFNMETGKIDRVYDMLVKKGVAPP